MGLFSESTVLAQSELSRPSPRSRGYLRDMTKTKQNASVRKSSFLLDLLVIARFVQLPS
jgi:hypothetical protein